MVYDPRNAQSQEVIEKPFSDGVTTSLSATVPTRIAGLQGFYGVRGVYSTKSGFNLSDVPVFILPPESRGTLQKQGYRYVSVSAQQYLYQDPTNPALGWGVFGELAARTAIQTRSGGTPSSALPARQCFPDAPWIAGASPISSMALAMIS